MVTFTILHSQQIMNSNNKVLKRLLLAFESSANIHTSHRKTITYMNTFLNNSKK